MAETDWHRIQMTDALIYPLKQWFRQRADVYVSGNMFLYYEEDNPKKFVAPDVFVVFGVANKTRRIYKVWQEGEVPAIVFELTSKSTRNEDISSKRFLYEELGVREYFLFDPLQEYLQPPLQGFRLTGDYYTPILPQQLDDGEWQMDSQELTLTLQTDRFNLRLLDPESGNFLLMPDEEAAAHRAAKVRALAEAEARYTAEARATDEAKARRAAEAEIERLRALLDLID